MGLKTSMRHISQPWYLTNYFSQVTTYGVHAGTFSRQINGVNDPKYLDRIRRGENASNAMSAFRQSTSWSEGKVSFKRIGVTPGTGGTNRMAWPGPIPQGIDPNLFADAKNKAAIGIRKKIDEMTTTVSGGVILGEIRQTVHMMRHPAEAITQLLTKFVRDHENGLKRARSLRIKNAKRKGRRQIPIVGYTFKNGVPRATADTIAKSYLELVFGLQPLMSDIASIAEASLSKYDAPRIQRIAFTAQAVSGTTTSVEYQPSGSVVWCPKVESFVDEVSVRYTVGYKITTQGVSEGWKRVYEMSGFDLAHIVPTAWNLLPWSFFIDYMSNIGDVIAANAVSLENVAWATMTTRRNARKTISIQCSKCRIKPEDAPFWTDARGTDYLGTSTIVETKREAASIPFGELRFSLPERRNQMFNIGALLWTQLKH